jgi:hypothetical protein
MWPSHDYTARFRKIRHAKKEGVKVTEYGSDIPEEIQQKCNNRINEWKDSREGQQVYLSEITPFTDSHHRQYLVADDHEKLHSLVVLAQPG